MAAFVFSRQTVVPNHTRQYANFIVRCFNEFGFASDRKTSSRSPPDSAKGRLCVEVRLQN